MSGRRSTQPAGPAACVMGNTDLVRTLAPFGVPCVAVAAAGAPVRYSRFTKAVVDWPSDGRDPEHFVERLVRFGQRQPEPPVLFYETDEYLLFVSRYRERLGSAFRFVIDDAARVEDMVDKARFHDLAARLGLPVPTTRVLSPSAGSAVPTTDLVFPLIVKPLTRADGRWAEVERLGKVVRVDTPAQLRAMWPRLAAVGQDFLVQEVIPGPETKVESYHVYVDDRGQVAGEFTGRKIRTRPVEYGHSTALEITDTEDVATLGRALVERLGLRGVAKLDFKRAPDGRLRLLEVNPRFNIWHYPGALAGVNLPGLVWADLTGRPRPRVTRARPGVCWCHPWDVAAARDWGVPLTRWLPWALRCEAKSVFNWDDPMPLIRHGAWRIGRRVSPRARRAPVEVVEHPTAFGADAGAMVPDRDAHAERAG